MAFLYVLKNTCSCIIFMCLLMVGTVVCVRDLMWISTAILLG